MEPDGGWARVAGAGLAGSLDAVAVVAGAFEASRVSCTPQFVCVAGLAVWVVA